MDIFQELGQGIEAAWSARDYDERAFPALAAAALSARQIQRQLGARDVLRWLLAAPGLPLQHDLPAAFGQPPITVFRGRRFFVDVNLWREGSTAIHRHGFSGAFQVLDGSSLHARYAFDVRRRVSARLLLGDLRLLDAEVEARGTVTEITHDLVHCLFHLETPSASIVVRTGREDDVGPQFSYLPPHVAEDPFSTSDPITVRRRQGLGFARRSYPAEYAELAAGVIEGSDLHTAYLVLKDAFHGPGAADHAAGLAAVARRRHGPVMDELVASIRQQLRDEKLARLYRNEKDPDLRFFLGLLRNLPDRRSIYAVLRRRSPEIDPRERVLAWMRVLSGVDAIGVDLGDSLNARIVEALLDGSADEALLARLAEGFSADEVRSAAPRLLRHAGRIRETSLFPLFR
jgi:hypothetical protein